MATPHHSGLRAEIPSLEPDGVLLDQLAELARSSALNGPPARTAPWTGWRVALAAAATASVIGGGAFVAAAMTDRGAHAPVPEGPVTHPGLPEPSEHQARHPDRASGRSGGAPDATTAADPQEQPSGPGDDGGVKPQGPATAPAGPVSHPTSGPTDHPSDQGEDDPSTGPSDDDEQGTDAPGDNSSGDNSSGDDSSGDGSTQDDGGDSGSDQAGQGDSADRRGE